MMTLQARAMEAKATEAKETPIRATATARSRAMSGADDVLRRQRPGTSVGYAATIVIGAALAWLYVAGWAYAFNHFDHFRIYLLTLQIPKEYFFVYGGFVVWHFPLWDVAIAAILIAATVLWPKLRIEAGRLQIMFSMLGLAAAFWLALHAGWTAADQQFETDREDGFRSHYSVQVFPRSDIAPAPDSPWSSTDLQNGCYRLILDNRDRLFLVRPVKAAPGAELPLVVLPRDQVESMRVVPGDMNCP
jgi:hypothetical protein